MDTIRSSIFHSEPSGLTLARLLQCTQNYCVEHLYSSVSQSQFSFGQANENKSNICALQQAASTR